MHRTLRSPVLFAGALTAAGILLLGAGRAEAQGCVCARQSTLVLGTQGGPYLGKGEWTLNVGFRSQRSDEFFSGSSPAKNVPDALRNQYIYELGGTYGLDRQTNITLTIPYNDLGFGLKFAPGQDRNWTRTSGIGDINLVARRWLLDVEKHTKGNVALGFGLKFPTGNRDAQDRYPRPDGSGNFVKPVDISSQPGDGGFGFLVDMNAFRQFGDVTGYVSALYLFNPKNTTSTASLPALLGPPGPPNARVNSVPDQFVGRLGVAVPIKKVKGLSLSFGGRIEGVPSTDALGDSDGFRFAGYVIFVEPGLSYTRGADTFAVSVPVRTYANIYNVATTPGPDIATVVDKVVLFSYTRRFGKGK